MILFNFMCIGPPCLDVPFKQRLQNKIYYRYYLNEETVLYQSYHKGSTHTFVSHTAAFILEPTQTISFYLTLMAGSFTIDRTKD